MTIAVDLGRKATKPTNNNNHNITLKDFALKLDLWFDTLQGRSQNTEKLYAHQRQTT